MALILPETTTKKTGLTLPNALNKASSLVLPGTKPETAYMAGYQPTGYLADYEEAKRKSLNIGLGETGETKTTTSIAGGEDTIKLALNMATIIRQEIARSGASVAITYQNVARVLTGQETIDQVDISGQGLERKILRAIFGERPLESLEYRIAQGEINAQKIGEEIEKTGKFGIVPLPKGLGAFIRDYASKISPVAIGLMVGLDFTGAGGSLKGASKILSQIDDVGDTVNYLNKMGVAKDLIDEFAPIIAKSKDTKYISKILADMDNIQRTSKGTAKFVDNVAPQPPKAPLEAVTEGKGIIPQDLQPLAQEAKKYKSAEEFESGIIDDIKQLEVKAGVSGKKLFGRQIPRTQLKEAIANRMKRIGIAKEQFGSLTDFYNQAVKGVGKGVGEVVETPTRLPTLIRGETFTLGVGDKVIPATKKEIRTAMNAEAKSRRLEIGKQKIRENTIQNINRFRGNIDNITSELKGRYLSDEDISNIVLEDGTKLEDVAKIKRNPDGSLAAVIKKSELDDISRNYTDEISTQKWEKKSMLVEGTQIPVKAAKSIELPYVWFEKKGLTQIYDPIIQAGRDAETMKTQFLQRFKDVDLYKEGGWFTANRFDISKSEAEEIGKYYLSRQDKGYKVVIIDLSPRAKKFVEIFDGIIKDTEPRFFETAKLNGKTPGVVANYAPIMTNKDIKLIDEGGSMDWLFRNHPAFFSLKERATNVPVQLYELDYREVASRWLDGVTDFLNYGDVTPKLKYLVNSDQFRSIIKENDWQYISNWLRDITTPERPSSMGGQSLNALSRLLRKGTAIGSLGLNYASVLKQALTQIPITIIEKVPPKLKSQYAKAFGIDVSQLPALTKRRGDIAIQDLQGKVGRVFTGPLTSFDRINAQASLNGFLDREWGKFLKEGVEIGPEIQRLIEKKAMDALDMWYGGFFKGQKPEAFRKELGNFILMFLYPLTSQLNGFYRAISVSKGVVKTAQKTAEVLASATIIAYLEQVIENLSPQWSDEKGMTKDVLLSLLGNIPVVGNIAYSISNETDFQISPSLGNVTKIIQNIGKGETEKVIWGVAETFGLPKTIRRIKEGMEIMEAGGITDDDGKMLAPVQDTIELVRSYLRGKYGSLAAQDWVRNIGEKTENRRWFVPEVEFLQNGDYERKVELYKQFDRQTQKELYNFLSEGQQKRLDDTLNENGKRLKL